MTHGLYRSRDEVPGEERENYVMKRCYTRICVLIGQLLRLVPGPISDMLVISVSQETGHATAALKHFAQGQSNGIPEVIDLVSGWQVLPIDTDKTVSVLVFFMRDNSKRGLAVKRDIPPLIKYFSSVLMLLLCSRT